jgi:uncharacterized Fe-S cluster-containing radical SAM superfamily protein
MRFCMVNLTPSQSTRAMKGYDPIKLTEKMESIVVDGNMRKYAKLSRPLRFYGGTTSAVEVGCNLRCKFCFSDKPVFRPQSTGKFYTPQQVFNALAKGAKRYGHKLISASASEGTLGRQHLFELLDLVEESEYVYILETNGMTLGDDKAFAEKLAPYKNLHVRVSIKGTSQEEYHELTDAIPQSYELPFKGLKYLIDAGVSCNACVMISFSDAKGIKRVEEKLYGVHPGLLKSLEKEHITPFPKVAQRLAKNGLKPNSIAFKGKVVNL